MRLQKPVVLTLVVLLTTVVLIGAALASVYGWIQWDAHQKATAVWKAYPQSTDKLEALILRLQSSDCPLVQRNEAVWILGRLGDERALPVLKKLYTGEPCEHNLYLCQYELVKTINRCGGNVNDSPANTTENHAQRDSNPNPQF